VSDTTRRFSAAKAFRCLLMAIGLGCFTLPAMAAKDCWTMWSPGGPVSNFLDSGAPATSGVFHDCRDTYGEVAAATYAAVAPEAQKIRDYSEFTQTTEIFPANCVANGEYGPLRWPQAKCYYSYRHTYVRKAPPNQVSYIEGSNFFELLMTCGEKFHTTPIGRTESTCKPIVDKVLPSPPSCGFGNPVEPLSGLKRQPEDLFNWGRGHTLSNTYWSNPQPPRGTLAEASAMKLYSARSAVEVAMEAVQLFGGNGYMAEFHVEQLARDAKVLQIYAGTDEIQITHIAKDLLRR
jgi:hypothetical protein